MDFNLSRHSGRYYGKYSGEVTDNEDDQNLGRITVKVPPVFGPDIEVRARPCLPFGHFYVPAVEAKVWIEFEAGDPNYPLWVGVWYPQDTPPEEAAISPPDNRVIQTPSGHTIELMDKEGEEKIIIRHKLDSLISIDKDGNVLIEHKDGAKIEITDGQTTIDCDTVTITGDATVQGTLTVGTGPTTTIDGNEITGGA